MEVNVGEYGRIRLVRARVHDVSMDDTIIQMLCLL
jgi:hypothetical protein